MKKSRIFIVVVVLTLCLAGTTFASTKDGEKAFLTDLKKAIPQDRITSVDDLYKTWQNIQTGKRLQRDDGRRPPRRGAVRRATR